MIIINHKAGIKAKLYDMQGKRSSMLGLLQAHFMYGQGTWGLKHLKNQFLANNISKIEEIV